MKLLIASRNPHKLAEIRAIFQLPGLEITGAHEITGLPEVIEDGRTFHANAVKKAVSLAMLTKLWTLADDSGLEVEALNGTVVRLGERVGVPTPIHRVIYAILLSYHLRHTAASSPRPADS